MSERLSTGVDELDRENAVSETLSRVFETDDRSPGFSVEYAGLDEPLANVREAIKLELGSEVRVDTSRDIA